MILVWIELFIALITILIAAQLFSNALEYLGEKLNISSGVIGSIFAAVSTALPESSVPILAMLAGTPDKLVNEEISVGAILGAPLMLSTLSTFLMAISVIKMRGLRGTIVPETSGFKRDLDFFIVAFILAAVAMFAPLVPLHLRIALSICLVLLYIAYVTFTFQASRTLVQDGHSIKPTHPLYATKIGLKNNYPSIIMQLISGLILLFIGAKSFINLTATVSHALNISPLLFSLLIFPIATELPEKINSIIWVRHKQDTLAFGNLNGAMVFQGTLLPAMGILLTPWQPNKTVLIGIAVTLAAAIWLRINTSEKGISILKLMLNGIIYVVYLGMVL